MSKIDGTNIPEGQDLNQAESEAKEKKEQDELIKKNLNNAKFLNFLQKNPDAINNATDDNYIKEKILIFEQIQKVKENVKRYLKEGSGLDAGARVDDSFVESVEKIAIDSPDDFAFFSSKIAKYLESVDKNKTLEVAYQGAASVLGMELNYNQLSDSDRRKFVEEVHSRIAQFQSQFEAGAEDAEKQRSFKSYIPFTETRKDYTSKIDSIRKSIAQLKISEGKLNKDSILATLGEIESIKSELKGNQAFEIVRDEFKKRVEERIKQAMDAGNDSSLIRDAESSKRMRANQSILEDDECDDIDKCIRDYSKEKLISGAKELVDKREAVTLNVFEKGITNIRDKGIKLGLTNEECNEQIIPVLKAKIDELTSGSNDPQKAIKLILAKRILNNLE
jgi:hypothetical protein